MAPSMQAVWITRLVMSWIAWDLTGSSAYVGLLSFFLFVPYITTIPFFGVLLDRIEPLRTAIIAQIIQALAAFTIFLMHITDSLSIFSLCTVAVIIGTANSAQGSARQTIVPRIVDKPTIANAVAFNAMNFQIARIIGPSVGGILIGLIGTKYTILFSSFFFLPALIALPMIVLTPKQGESIKIESNFISELVDGARFAHRNAVIFECIILTFISSVIIRGCHELLPALADGKFNMGVEGLGQIMAAAGAGAAGGRGGPGARGRARRGKRGLPSGPRAARARRRRWGRAGSRTAGSGAGRSCRRGRRRLGLKARAAVSGPTPPDGPAGRCWARRRNGR